MSDRKRYYTTVQPSDDNNTQWVFISGKVTGRDYEEARKQFDKRAEELEEMGYAVYNPMDMVAPGTSWQVAMRICLHYLCCSDYIDMLPGWGSSDGSRMEYHLACKLGIKKFEL